jgi:hypothetical protein
MPMTMRAAGAVLALALAAAVAACGGDDDGGDKLSKAEYIEQADRACVDSALRPKAPPQNSRQAAQQTKEEADARKDLQGDLQKLTPPDELKGDADEFLKKSQELIAGLERMTRLAEDDKQAEFAKEDQKLADVGQSREQVADRIGFKRCGQPFTPEEQEEQQNPGGTKPQPPEK